MIGNWAFGFDRWEKSSCYACWGLCVNVSGAHTSLKYTYETVLLIICSPSSITDHSMGRGRRRESRRLVCSLRSSPRKHTPLGIRFLLSVSQSYKCDIHGAPTWKMIISIPQFPSRLVIYLLTEVVHEHSSLFGIFGLSWRNSPQSSYYEKPWFFSHC